MAVFGVQLVVTMVMASVLSKLGPHYSLARWLLCKTGLMYYLHPTDEELKSKAGIVKERPRKKHKDSKGGKSGSEEKEDVFMVPRSLDITLEMSRIIPGEIMQLKYYPEYQWLLDFSLCSFIVYIITEVYLGLVPIKEEVNLSMLWCLLVIGFSFKVLFNITKLYFIGDNSGGEKAMVILSFFIYLLIALGMLIVDESKLDTGLDLAYSSFNQSAATFLRAQGLDSEGPASKVTFKIALAMFCALIGAFFTFPGLRLGRMHWDSLKYCTSSSLLRMLFHLSFLAPLFLVLMWVKPISHQYLTATVFRGHSSPIMSEEAFETMRIAFVLVVGLLRLCIMPYYLQSYLNMAHERLEEQKKESGKISNKELQRKVARVFYYLCVVTLQYIVPIVLFFFLALMCKTLGGMEWKALLGKTSNKCGLEPPDDVISAEIPSLQQAEGIVQASRVLSLSLEELKKVFTSELYKGVLGFATWWCVFTWFLSGTFGVLYQSYFAAT